MDIKKLYEDACKKADELLSKMTLTEKVGQLSQFGTSIYTTDDGAFDNYFAGGKVGSYLSISGAERTNRMQERLLAITKLKIPALFGDDVIHGYRTIAPIPLAQSATWEPELTKKSCEVAAKESYAAGLKWTFSPMVDIARDPRWGRIAEGYGEDTYLCCDFARAAVKGYQGDYIGQKDHVLACMKHFVGYGACVGGRDYDSVDMSQETLFDVYIPPFKAGIDAGAATVMAAFNDLNGVPCSGNKYLMRDILRKKLGFKGFVVSDANSVRDLIRHGNAENSKEAARLAFGGGVDMNMAISEEGIYNDWIGELIEEGKIDAQLVDDSVRVILTLKYMLGLFDEPYVDPKGEECFYAPEHLEAARECAKNSIVLLENDGVLPLKEGTSVALVGPFASDKLEILGTWARFYDTEKNVSIEEGLKEAHNGEIITVRGCGFGFEEEQGDYKKEIKDAVAKAEKCDVIIACVGENMDLSGEASSRTSLDIPGHQKELIEELLKTEKPVVLLVGAGRPLILTEYKDRAAAIVYMWHLGTETGHAVADVLTGAHNPSGHLTVSFPRCVGQVPVHYNHYSAGKPALNKQRYEAKYLDTEIGALYPFGYGKSYTDFSYSNMVLSSNTMSKRGSIKVSVDVENTGNVAGSDVVQLYIRDLFASRVRPVRELKGYKKLYLKPGEKKKVTFTLKAKDLAFTNEKLKKVVEEGEFHVFVAHDSSDTKLTESFWVK